MFRPTKIYHTTVILEENKVNTLINRLHELGLCELKEQGIKDFSAPKSPNSERSEICLSSKYSYEQSKDLDDIQTRFNFIDDSLEEYKEIIQPGNRLKNIFSPKPPRRHKSEVYSPEELIREVSHNLSLIEPKVLEKLEHLQKVNEQVQNKEFIISNLSSIPDMKTNIFISSENIKILLGLVNNSSIPKINEELEDNSVIVSEEKDKNQTFISIFTTPNELANADKVLHSVGFQQLDIPYENKEPEAIIMTLKSEIVKLENEKIKISNFLKKTRKSYNKKLALLSEELRIAKQKILALHNFQTTKSFSILEVWVPKNNLEKFNKVVKETSKNYYMEADEKDTAPTLLNNHKLIKPFEMITELYSPPKYNGFDPTPLLAITFTIFFGFMLTDVAYGLMLLAMGWVMYRGIGKFNESMKNFAIIIIAFGISTVLIGAVFGSYFGNFFQELGINLPIPIDSMRQVMLTLSIALALGALHLIMGLVAGFYENIHQGSFKEAMAKQGVWLIFMVGLVLFLLKLNTIGLIVIITAVLLQMFFSFLEGGLVTSILSIFGFSGFIGDLFSYARLMALAIGTAGIALAVNFMVFMVIDLIPWIGYPIAVIVFIIGHLFNVAMNGLGAFIHSTRLHFLEFFTKFYDGGGRTYKPFLAKRENTFIEIEGGP